MENPPVDPDKVTTIPAEHQLALCYHLDGKKRFLILNKPRITIGRSPESSLQLDHGCVSRTHCNIMYRSGIWLIQDWKSSNGTKMKEVHLEAFVPYVLMLGSSFTISDITFTVEEMAMHTDTDTVESIPIIPPAPSEGTED